VKALPIQMPDETRGGASMSREETIHERLLIHLPHPLSNPCFLLQGGNDLLNSRTPPIECAKNHDSTDDEDTLPDSVYDAYMACAKEVLSLAWDGDAPGMSGSLSIMECEGVYIITSSDFDDLGPYSSLEDALSDDCFSIVTSSPELHSEVLPKKRLLEIAGQVVDWENGGSVEINSKTYRTSGDKLVLESLCN
jgi:hypothetical protein